jgi:DNA-binding HxlR family transcriptional regulator
MGTTETAAKAKPSKPSKPAGASGRQYSQYCPVARALDSLGERWTLLVVRSLLMGPQRYSDLQEALPGIATDLLTARLRSLEGAGYVRRRQLPRPARVSVYELTGSGRELAPLVLALAKVGMQTLGAPGADEEIDGESLVLSLRASFDAVAPPDSEDSYQLELGPEQFVLKLGPGGLQTMRGVTADPRATLATDPRTLAQILSGALAIETAISQGALRISGARRAAERVVSRCAYPAASSVPRGYPG